MYEDEDEGLREGGESRSYLASRCKIFLILLLVLKSCAPSSICTKPSVCPTDPYESIPGSRDGSERSTAGGSGSVEASSHGWAVQSRLGSRSKSSDPLVGSWSGAHVGLC